MPNERALPPSYRVLPGQRPVRAEGGTAAGLHHLVARDRLTGILELAFTTVAPLHVGTGAPTLLGGGIVKALVETRTADGEAVPVVPGASLKGVLRSRFEALFGGCDLEGDCHPPCRACTLFGQVRRRGQLMGRLGVSDAFPEDPQDLLQVVRVPRAFSPRRKGGRRVYAPPAPDLPAEVPLEVVKVDTVFRTRLQLLNVAPWELGGVLLGAGFDGSFRPRIGGGKYGGLGQVRFDPKRLVLRQAYERPGLRTLEGGELQGYLAECYLDAEARLTEEGKRALEILKRAEGPAGPRVDARPAARKPRRPHERRIPASWSASQLRLLLEEVWRVHGALARPRPAGGGRAKPVGAAFVGSVLEAVRLAADAGEVREFLRRLPGSYLGRYTASARGDLDRIAQETLGLLDRLERSGRVPPPEVLPAVEYVLGWVRRLLPR